MNSLIKGVLVFAIGAAIGALTTYKMMKDRMEENNFLEEDIYEYDTEEHPRPVNRQIDMEEIELAKEDFTRSVNEKFEKKIISYNNISAKPDLTSLIEDDIKPKIITVHQFDDENTWYEKKSLWFYEKDDTVADEEEKIVDDPCALIGFEALLSFGQGSEDSDVVYVRNSELGVDYEVVRLDKSYQEVVLGIKPEESHRKKVKQDDAENEESNK